MRGLSPVIEMAGQRGKRKLIAAKLRAGVGDDVIKQSSGVTERLIRSVNYQMKKKEVKAAASISIAQLPPDGPPCSSDNPEIGSVAAMLPRDVIRQLVEKISTNAAADVSRRQGGGGSVSWKQLAAAYQMPESKMHRLVYDEWERMMTDAGGDGDGGRVQKVTH